MSIPGTWSHAAMWTLLVLIALVSLAYAVRKPLKRWLAARSRLRRRQATPKPDGAIQKRCHVVDYSAARDKAIDWLGERYLLAKPINRRGS